MNTATLIIIDMLNDFFRDGPLSERRDELVERTNHLSRAFRKHRQPVIWVRQEFSPDLSDAFRVMRARNIHVTIVGTKGAAILPELERDPTDTTIVKKRYSAFFHTNLDDVLAESPSTTLVVAGINTHACVRSTVIDAYQRDWPIVIADECTASYDAEHHRVTRTYLDGKIAVFLNNDEIAHGLATGRLPV